MQRLASLSVACRSCRPLGRIGKQTAAMQQQEEGEFIATLIHPEGYAKQVNQVATVWSNQLRFIKRKELALEPFAVGLVPIAAVRRIVYRRELAIAPFLVGVLILFIIAIVLLGPIPAGTHIPVGALAVAGYAGCTWMRGVKRHRIDFELPDRVLSWRSKAGDLEFAEPSVNKVVEFARSRGLLASASDRGSGG